MTGAIVVAVVAVGVLRLEPARTDEAIITSRSQSRRSRKPRRRFRRIAPDLAKMTIRSPINGIVLTRAVERGQSEGTAVADIDQSGPTRNT